MEKYSIEATIFNKAIARAQMTVLESRALRSAEMRDELDKYRSILAYLKNAVEDGMTPTMDAKEKKTALTWLTAVMVLALNFFLVYITHTGHFLLRHFMKITDWSTMDAVIVVAFCFLEIAIITAVAIGLDWLLATYVRRPSYINELEQLIKDLDNELSHCDH